MHYLAGSFDVGIVSQRSLCPEKIKTSSTVDRELVALAASVDGLALFLNLQQLKSIDHNLLRQWLSTFERILIQSQIHISFLSEVAVEKRQRQTKIRYQRQVWRCLQ